MPKNVHVNAEFEIKLNGAVTLKDLEEFVETANKFGLPDDKAVYINDGYIRILIIDYNPEPISCGDCERQDILLNSHPAHENA